jgi:hypothetical protein
MAICYDYITYTFWLINYIQYATLCDSSVFSLLVTIYNTVLSAETCN